MKRDIEEDVDLPAVFRAVVNNLAGLIAERIKLQKEKRLYSVKEAAIYLSCSEEQIDTYVKERGLRRTMIDRRPRYDIGDLDRFIDSAKSAGRR
jgi:hypothetical protein